MSTRYLWDKFELSPVTTGKTETEFVFYNYDSDTGTSGYVYLASDITINADKTVNLTGSVKQYPVSSVADGSTFIYDVSAETYRYMATVKRSNVKRYIESPGEGYWNVKKEAGRYSVSVSIRSEASTSAPKMSFTVYFVGEGKGPKIGLASSASSDAYPQDGEKNGFWYTYKGSDSIDPLSVTYNTDRPERGKPVTVAVEPAPISAETPQWTASTLPASAVWSGVAYGGGWFITVGGNSDIARSSDGGKTWSSVSSNVSDASAITYANGKFVVVGYNSAAYSTDNGTTWTAAASFPDGQWSAVCYGGGKFVAVDSSANKAMYSSDGNVWTEISLPSGGGWPGIAYGNGRFVATTMGKIAYSDNLTEWTAVQVGYDMWRAVTFSGEKFVMVGSGGNSAYSTNGEGWTVSAVLDRLDLKSVAYGNGNFIAVGALVQGDSSQIGAISVRSADAASWETMTMPSSEEWYAIAYGGGGFAAVSMQSDAAAYLPDEVDLGYTVSYLYQYSINGGSSWITVGAATEDTQIEIIIPENAEQFMARARAQDDIGFTSADYVAGANLAVQTMRLCIGVNSVARKGVKSWVSPDGTAHRFKRAFVGIDGKARRWF